MIKVVNFKVDQFSRRTIKIMTYAIRNKLLLTLTLLSLLMLGGCITDPGASKGRGLVKDFSIVNNTVGCNSKGATNILILPNTPSANDSVSYACTSSCPTDSTHLATATELATLKKTVSSEQLLWINNSANVCVANPQKQARPTNAIDIKSDFCSCLNGKSDLISDCSAFCSTVANTNSPTLYLNTIMGPDIALNTQLGNLSNWCSVQLTGDTTAPQCFLQAQDGPNIISNIPVNVAPNSNSLTANIQQLALNRTYIVKIVEGKTGSNAQSKEFQLRRVPPAPTVDQSQLGTLKVTPINQYTCLTYGLDQTGTLRQNYARVFYYFAANETPPPIPPAGVGVPTQVVCHDAQLHPGNDNALYPRLELIPQAFAMWDKTDPRFVTDTSTTPVINQTLVTRLLNEYGVAGNNVNLFTPLSYPNRPVSSTSASANIVLGYIMSPFFDPLGKSFCPTQTDFNGNIPIFNLLKEYMDDTEGLYVAEKEAENIIVNNNNTVIYGTMFVTETILKKYGFYIENGLKIKADQSAMNTKTIYYYWPTDDTMDPLTAGIRKMFTVRTPDTLNGNKPTGPSATTGSSDKRIGCVPKSH